MNEFTALRGILAPGTAVAGYQRGHEVPPEVVEAWNLVVGDDVVEGDLDEDSPREVIVQRPDDGANRAAWESYAVANGMPPEDAAAVSMEDLQAVGDRPDPADDDRPADSAKKDAWIEYAVSRGLDRATAESKTKGELQDWTANADMDAEPVGDPVAISASESLNH